MPRDNLKQFLQVRNISEYKADLYFYGNIVSNWWGAWDDADKYPEEIRTFLDGVKGKDLNVYVNSPGGSVFAGMAIYNMIKRHDGYVTFYNDGLMGSIMSVVPLSGNKIIIPPGSHYFIHKPSCQMLGNADDFRKQAEFLDDIQKGLLDIYTKWLKEGVEPETINNFINQGKNFRSDEVFQYFNFENGEENSASILNCFEGYENSIAELKSSKELLQAKLRLLNLKGKELCQNKFI
ncbi:MAG: Clp protease ClpP [Candidatus Gastranaerophilales bacterium]|nr:Clp protease ClpP [Candidatus Gastranaerophilales bacterium]